MIRKTLTTALAAAVVATTTFAISQPADAKMRHMKKMTKVRLVPSQQKASYHGVAAGSPPMLVDIQQVPPGGGVLGLGVAPSSGFFKGVPVFGDLGL